MLHRKLPLVFRDSRVVTICAALALTALYTFSRTPFLALGYGLDDDAWFIARTADTLASGGGYAASRLPGYPTVEMLYAGLFSLFGTSFVVGNLAASVAGLAAALGIWLLLKEVVDAPLRLLAAAAVAFHPAIWTASVTTLDPIFGTAFLVLAAAAVGRRHPWMGGVLLGLAVGCRLTHALAALPIALFARSRCGGWKAATHLVAVGGLVGGTLFLLPALTHGIGFLSFEPAFRRDYLTGGYKVYRELVGFPLALGLAATAATLATNRDRRRRLFASVGEPVLLLGVSAIVVLATPFVLLPTDAQYLLPWVPFGVLVLAASVRARAVAPSWAALLLLAAMIPSAVGLGQLDLDAWRTDHVLRPVWAGPGFAAEDRAERASQLAHASAAARYDYPAGAAVIIGRPFLATQRALGVPEREFADYLYEDPNRDVLLFRLIPLDLRPRIEFRPVFYATGEHLPYLTRRIFGYELDDLDARPIELWPVPSDERQSSDAR